VLAFGDIDVRSSSNSVTLLSRLLIRTAGPAGFSACGNCSFSGAGGVGLDLPAQAAAASVAGGGGTIEELSSRDECPASWRLSSACSAWRIGKGFSLVSPADRSGRVGFAGSSFDSRLSGDVCTAVLRLEGGGDNATPMASGLTLLRLEVGGGGG
jgi:hypothetical protein